ncbi:MAG: hypothetical protein RLZZ42_978 [Bacteroidota bacterium]
MIPDYQKLDLHFDISRHYPIPLNNRKAFQD